MNRRQSAGLTQIQIALIVGGAILALVVGVVGVVILRNRAGTTPPPPVTNQTGQSGTNGNTPVNANTPTNTATGEVGPPPVIRRIYVPPEGQKGDSSFSPTDSVASPATDQPRDVDIQATPAEKAKWGYKATDTVVYRWVTQEKGGAALVIMQAPDRAAPPQGNPPPK